MKLSPKTLVPVFAAFATLAFAAPAFASEIAPCIPMVIPMGPDGPMITFCIPSDPGPPVEPIAPVIPAAVIPAAIIPAPVIPVTPPAPAAVVIPVAPVELVISHDDRPFMCHYESTVGFSGPRRSNDLLKDLGVAGNTALGADGLCAKPIVG